MFEKATRLHLRFPSPKGLLTVEDLWDLPLTSTTGKANLDDIARSLDATLKSGTNISFVKADTNEDTLTKLQFEIVIHIINTKVTENANALASKAKREKKQQLLEVLERKQNAQLENLSVDELKALIESM